MSDENASNLVAVDSTSQKYEPEILQSQTEKNDQNAEENIDNKTDEITAHLGTPSRDSNKSSISTPIEQQAENTHNSDDKQIEAGNDDGQKKLNTDPPPSLYISPSMEIGNAYDVNEKEKKKSGNYGYLAADGNDDEEDDEVVDEDDTVQTKEEAKKEYSSCLKSTNNPRTKNRMQRLEDGTVIVVHFDERVVVHTVPYWDPCGETYPYCEDDSDDDEPRGPNCCSIL